MPLTDTDWSVTRSTKVIAYIGDDHNGTAPSYATVIEFHRWLQGLADDALATGDDELDITNIDPSRRSTDNIITLINGYTIGDTEAEHLYDGSVIYSAGAEIYDGIVNFGNASVQIQIMQNGAVLADDWWNKGLGGAHDGSSGAAVLTDGGETWTTDEWVGYTIYNTTDGSQALATSNTGTTITGLLHGDNTSTNNNLADDDWDAADTYLIGRGLNADSAQGISHRFMIKTRTGGADVDGRRLIGTNRRNGNTFGEFKINGTSRGNNVLALSDSADLNNATAIATVGALSDVYIDRTVTSTTVSGVNAIGQAVLNVVDGTQFAAGDFILIVGDDDEYQINSIATNALTLNHNLAVATTGGEVIYDLNIGFTQIDVNNNAANEDYYAQWDRGANSINTFFERLKYLSRDGSPEYIYGIGGELFRGITHEIVVDTHLVADLIAVESVSWSGGTGQMFAADELVQTTGATTIWIQLLTGIAPTDGQTITGGISGATIDVNATVTDRSSLIKTPFVGASTGSALIGSYGLSLQTADLTSSDIVFDLTNAQITPPNNVTNTVSGLVSGEDRVLVAPWDGSTTDVNGDPAITKDLLGIKAASALTTDNITSVLVDATIPADTPPDGYIRVVDNNGFERRLHYSAWATDTFTVDTTDGNEDFAAVNANAANDVYIAYIDVLAGATTATFTSVQSSSRNLVLIVRDGGGTPIKQYISSWSQTSSDQTISVIRTTDE